MTISTADAILYSGLIFLTFVIDAFVLYIIFSLKLSNDEDDNTGEIVGISPQKYFKIILIGIFYGLVTLTLNLMNAIAQTLVDIPQFAGIISGLFLIMLRLAWIWTVCIIIWLVYVTYKDGNLYKELKKAYQEAGG